MSRLTAVSTRMFPSFLALLLAIVPLAAAGAAPRQAGPDNKGQLALDVYALRGPQDQTAQLYLSVADGNGVVASQEQFEKVWVEVRGPNGRPHNTWRYSNVDSSNGQAVIDLGDVPLAEVVSVKAQVST